MKERLHVRDLTGVKVEEISAEEMAILELAMSGTVPTREQGTSQLKTLSRESLYELISSRCGGPLVVDNL